ncbi:MAG: hypothetical protein GX287_01600 [Fusobacteria bacterium]|nr:hypothetical protein [Fusobacteriota bacterium]
MKKILLWIIITIFITTIGAIGYITVSENNKPSIESFVIEDIDTFMYFKTKNKYSKNIKKLRKQIINGELENEQLKEIVKYSENFEKYVKEGILLLNIDKSEYNTELFNNFEETILVLNPEQNYKIVMPFIKQAFNKNEKGIYILKDEIKKEIFNSEYEDYNLYLTVINQYFVVSLSEENLLKYNESYEKKGKNTKIIKDFKNIKPKINDFYYVINMENLENEYINQIIENEYMNSINLISIYTENIDNKLKFNFNFDGDGKFFDLLDSSKLANRDLISYVDYNDIYLSNNNIPLLLTEIYNSYLSTGGVDYLQIIQIFTGVNHNTIVKDFSNEIIIKTENFSKLGVLLKSNNLKQIETIIDNFGLEKDNEKYNFGDMYFTLKDNFFGYNCYPEISNNNMKIGNNNFLYMNFRLDKILNKENIYINDLVKNIEEFNYDQLLEDGKYFDFEINGIINKNSLNISLSIDYKNIEGIFNYLEKIVK